MIWLPSSPLLASPLAKLPVLLASTAVTSWAQFPPNPPPSDSEELAKYDGSGDALSTRRSVNFAVVGYQITYWLNAIAETTVILAAHAPRSAIASRLLALCARDSDNLSYDVRITPWWLAGCALMTAGASLRLACYHTMGRLFTWELTLKKDHSLVTNGPYSVVRHPSYTGSVMIGVGVVLCYFSPGSWYRECVGWETVMSKVFTAAVVLNSLGIPLMLLGRVSTEDEVLRKEFGPEWESYAKRTPYKLIPYIY